MPEVEEGTNGAHPVGGGLPAANRNSDGNGLLESGVIWGTGEVQPHPAESLFDTGLEDDIETLIKKSDIPEKMVPIIGRMLWIAERYTNPVLRDMVKWYLLSRIPKDREGRKEFMDVLMNMRQKSEEEELASL
jgi:hypothetical protein